MTARIRAVGLAWGPATTSVCAEGRFASSIRCDSPATVRVKRVGGPHPAPTALLLPVAVFILAHTMR